MGLEAQIDFYVNLGVDIQKESKKPNKETNKLLEKYEAASNAMFRGINDILISLTKEDLEKTIEYIDKKISTANKGLGLTKEIIDFKLKVYLSLKSQVQYYVMDKELELKKQELDTREQEPSKNASMFK